MSTTQLMDGIPTDRMSSLGSVDSIGSEKKEFKQKESTSKIIAERKEEFGRRLRVFESTKEVPSPGQEPSFSGSGGTDSSSASSSASKSKRRYDSAHAPEQQVALINIAHVGQRPKNARPCYRFLGFFPNRDAALKHVKTTLKNIEDCAIHLVPAGKKTLLCENMKRQYHEQYVLTKIDIVTNKYQKERELRLQEFKKNKDSQNAGQSGLSHRHRRHDKESARRAALEAHFKKQAKKASIPKPTLDTVKEQITQTTHTEQSSVSDSNLLDITDLTEPPQSLLADTKESKTPTPTSTENTNKRKNKKKQRRPNQKPPKNEASDLPATCVVRNQSVVVVSCIQDNTAAVMKGNARPEPIMIFWRAFATEDEATDYVQSMGSKLIRDVDLDVVDCYEWQFPEDTDQDKVREGFRSKELGNLMEQRKSGKDEVEEFERWCESEHLEVPKTEFIFNPDTGETSVIASDHMADLTAHERLTLDSSDTQVSHTRIQADYTIRVVDSMDSKDSKDTQDSMGSKGSKDSVNSKDSFDEFGESVKPQQQHGDSLLDLGVPQTKL